MRFFVFAITALLSGMSVLSQESSADEQNQSWYLSGSYSTAVWSSDYWNEKLSPQPDTVRSHDSANFEEFNNHSLGFGYRTGRFQTDLVYEDFGTVNWVMGRTVDNRNRVFDGGGLLTVESINLMVQIAYDLYQSNDNEIFMLLGMGQSKHYVDTAYLMISGVRVDYALPNKKINTSYRFGLGNRYALNEHASLEAKLNYSDYGKAWNKFNGNGLESYNIKMQAVEAGISLKYYF